MSVKVRFAPSPTGIPHVGNIRTALFDYFYARHNDGKFILRIEDTDQARKVEGAIEAIRESLSWLGIKWDEEFTQSSRLSEYRQFASELIKKGHAVEEEGAVRFLVTDEGVSSWIDAIGSKKIEFQNSEIENFIIIKKDGFPTYHLANVVDDHLMGITHVIRGEDWIPSTPKHIMLYKAFGWDVPVFAHVPNVLAPDRSKLSKRRGAKSVLDYKKEGILSDALLNYLMLLGWSPKDNREFFTKKEFEKEFDLTNVNIAPSIFDEKKLLWMNGVYIREKLDNSQLISQLKLFYGESSDIMKYIVNEKVISLAKTRMETLESFAEFVRKEDSENDPEICSELKKEFALLQVFEKEEIFSVFKKIMEKKNLRMPVFYKIFTGRETGLPLPDFLASIGKEEAISRLI